MIARRGAGRAGRWRGGAWLWNGVMLLSARCIWEIDGPSVEAGGVGLFNVLGRVLEGA